MNTLNKVQHVLLVVATLTPIAMISVVGIGIMDGPVTDYDLLYWIAVWLITTILWLFSTSINVDEYGYYIKDKFQFYTCVVMSVLLIVLMFIL